MTWVIYNDLQLLPFYGLLLLHLVLIYICMVLWHEIGHYLYFDMKLGKKIEISIKRIKGLWFKIKAGNQSDYLHLTPEQHMGVAGAGIFMGLAPVILVSLFNTSPFPYVLMAIPYLAGCITDLKIMFSHLHKMDLESSKE